MGRAAGRVRAGGDVCGARCRWALALARQVYRWAWVPAWQVAGGGLGRWCSRGFRLSAIVVFSHGRPAIAGRNGGRDGRDAGRVPVRLAGRASRTGDLGDGRTLGQAIFADTWPDGDCRDRATAGIRRPRNRAISWTRDHGPASEIERPGNRDAAGRWRRRRQTISQPPPRWRHAAPGREPLRRGCLERRPAFGGRQRCRRLRARLRQEIEGPPSAGD